MTENNDEVARTWGMLAHLSSLAWIPLAFIGLTFPIVNILGPLIIWLAKRNEHPFIDEQGKESLNFQISVTLYSFVTVIVFVVLGIVLALVIGATASSSFSASGGIFALVFVFGFLGLIILSTIVGIIELVIVIFAAIKANNGESYCYPLTIRLLNNK